MDSEAPPVPRINAHHPQKTPSVTCETAPTPAEIRSTESVARGGGTGGLPSSEDTAPDTTRRSARTLALLYVALQPRVERIARLLLRSHPPHELVHDDSVDAALSSVNFRGDAAFSSWLYAVVARHVHKWIRTEQRRRRMMREFTESVHGVGDPMQPDEQLGGTDLECMLRHGLAMLPERQRTCLVLVQVQERPVNVVAAELGMTPEAVRMNISRARSQLRKWLDVDAAPTRPGSQQSPF